MPSFGKGSQSHFDKLHPDLKKVLAEAIHEFDFAIIQATRSREEQEEAFNHHCSKAHYGQSAHNFEPSYAVDCAPWPIDWSDLNRFSEMASVILKHAAKLNVALTWGGHWISIKDYPHFELSNWKQLAKGNANVVS